MSDMKRREFLKSVVMGSFIFLPKFLRSKNLERPNIIFLLTDDQRYDTLGCMGNKQVKTPNFDKLAADGVVFDSHYDTTSICMASRASIMTGLYEYRTGCNFTRGSLVSSMWEQSYPVLLRKAGYYTGFAGKFGFGVTDTPNNSGYHTYDRMPIDSFDVWGGWPGQGFYNTKKNKYIAHYASKYPHTSRALGAFAQDFIKDAVKRKQPFCLSISFKAPHAPLQPDPVFDDVYKDTVWEIPPNYFEKGAAHLPKQAKSGRQYIRLGKIFGPEKYQESMRKYNQQIYGVDYAIGMIRSELKKQGVANNTVIIVTSDNGYFCGAHGLGGKVLPYEEGSRAPLIIYDPRHPNSGKKLRSSAVTGNIDIMPTILDFAGLPIPENIDGKSLRSLLDNPDGKVRDALTLINAWGNIPTHELSVITENYKYIYWFYAGKGFEVAEELYDVKNDKYEMNNLINDPSKKDVLEKMRLLYDRAVKHWQKTCVKRGGYPEWGKMFDRSVPWEEKIKTLPEKLLKKYMKV